jgi:hypothetical protein
MDQWTRIKGDRRRAYIQKAGLSETRDLVVNPDAKVEFVPGSGVWVQAWVCVEREGD